MLNSILDIIFRLTKKNLCSRYSSKANLYREKHFRQSHFRYFDSPCGPHPEGIPDVGDATFFTNSAVHCDHRNLTFLVHTQEMPTINIKEQIEKINHFNFIYILIFKGGGKYRNMLKTNDTY